MGNWLKTKNKNNDMYKWYKSLFWQEEWVNE